MQAQGNLLIAELMKVAERDDLGLWSREAVHGLIGAEVFKGTLLVEAVAFRVFAQALTKQFEFGNVLAAEPGPEHMFRDPNQPGVKRGATLETWQRGPDGNPNFLFKIFKVGRVEHCAAPPKFAAHQPLVGVAQFGVSLDASVARGLPQCCV